MYTAPLGCYVVHHLLQRSLYLTSCLFLASSAAYNSVYWLPVVRFRLDVYLLLLVSSC